MSGNIVIKIEVIKGISNILKDILFNNDHTKVISKSL